MSNKSVKVKIYNPDIGVTSYGKSEKRWFLKFVESKNTRSIDSAVGWTSIENPESQVKLRFDSKDLAVKYAEKEGYDYVVLDQKETKIRKKSYQENFLK